MERQQVTKTNQQGDKREMHHVATGVLPTRATVHPLQQLQRALGNQAMVCFVQAKLEIGQPGNIYEQEADRIAEQVMRMPENTALSGQPSGVRREDGHIQRMCAECASGKGQCPECAEEEMVQRKPLTSEITPMIQRQEVEVPEEETLQTKEVAGGAPAISTSAEARINNMRGNGQPLPDSVCAFFEPRFGHDFSHVRVHTDVGAAESARSVNALAYTAGQDVVFGAGQYAPDTSKGRQLLAHELTHVVQQGDISTSASPVSRTLSAGGLVVQRFGAGEHMKLGDAGTKGEQGEVKTVQLADDYRITFGEMVAMAGDHFETIEQMRDFAKRVGLGANTREEIEYVRVVHIHGRKEAEKSFSKEAREAADKRYYQLAGVNRSHFLIPTKGDESRTTSEKSGDTIKKLRVEWNNSVQSYVTYDVPLGAGAGYRMNHLKALFEAYSAGQLGQSVDTALAAEAFGGHFLTDSFSGGHVRTARASITEHWNSRVPMFYYNLKGYVAEKMAEKLEKEISWGVFSEEAIYKGPLWFKGAVTAVSETLEAKGVFTFGDVVSGAVHDYDNKYGVIVTIEGKDSTLYGDSHLGTGDEEKFATQAVNLSYKEVLEAWKLGTEHKLQEVVLQSMAGDNLFAAERLLPKPVADEALPPEKRRVKWNYDDVRSLFSDGKFIKALKVFLADKAGEFESAAAGLTNEQQRKAFTEQVVNPLKAEPIKVIWQVIHWTPDTGGGVFGHNQDDNALDYYETSKKMGALGMLTVTQKTNLILDLLGGPTFADEEYAIWDLLTVKESDVKAIIDNVGWDRLEDEIGSKFAKKFPKREYGKKH